MKKIRRQIEKMIRNGIDNKMEEALKATNVDDNAARILVGRNVEDSTIPLFEDVRFDIEDKVVWVAYMAFCAGTGEPVFSWL